MNETDSYKLVALIVAAYPNWKPTEETQRLYAGYLRDYPLDVTAEQIDSIIKSSRDFAPPVGLVITKVESVLEDRERQARFSLPRKYPVGELRVSAHGVYYCADENGDMKSINRTAPVSVSKSVSRINVSLRYACVACTTCSSGAICQQPLRSVPSNAAKTAFESKRGTHIQSIEPSLPTSAAVRVFPISA